jgi:hypothetical protein
LLEEDYSVIDVAAAEEFSAAGNSFNEIVYNRLTGNLFYNTNNATVGLGVGGGRFATITLLPLISTIRTSLQSHSFSY